ncbi:MAG: DUF547 domain-containing protein [Alphaproteobacteria bacterium]|nr:DUF547 domain-containing protein [Alphaproteobacteria bacterium]
MFFSLAAFGSLESLFAPKAGLWPVWETHDAESRITVDHSIWDEFLRQYVRRGYDQGGDDGVNQVAYAAVSTADRQSLREYLKQLSTTPVSTLRRAAQLAYWINLYNALTVNAVLDHYPVASIRDINISPGWFSKGPWGKALIVVETVSLSLNDIEHRILRPIWRDPRLHYALNCAAIGCPDLQQQAFTAINTPALLDRAARAFVNSARGATVTDDTLVLSSIYAWFVEDFGGDAAGVLRHLRKYAAPALTDALDNLDAERAVTSIENDYNWSLNDMRPQ